MHNDGKFTKKKRVSKTMNEREILILPHGWVNDVAKTLGVHRNTVANAMRTGSGDTYRRVMTVVAQKYSNSSKM